MDPTHSTDEAVSVFLAEFELLMDSRDERLELESLRSKWRRINDWKMRAEVFVSKNQPSFDNPPTADEIKRLKNAICMASADLKLTPEAIMKAAEQVARGEVIPASVLRAELEERKRMQSQAIAG